MQAVFICMTYNSGLSCTKKPEAQATGLLLKTVNVYQNERCFISQHTLE